MNKNNSTFQSNFEISSDDKSTSSSSLVSSYTNQTKSTEQLIHLKETKTHLYCLIPSDNESNENVKKTPQLIQIKISKRRPQSRPLTTNKVLGCLSLAYGSSDDELLVQRNQQRIRQFLNSKTSKSSPTSNRKKTNHPSFVVLPESSLINKKRGEGYIKSKVMRNQSTSDNSNKTFVIRSKEDNKLLASRANTTSVGSIGPCTSISNRNVTKETEASFYGGVKLTKSKPEDYCECAKKVKARLKDKLDGFDCSEDIQKFENDAVVPPKDTQAKYNDISSDELFRIKFNDPSQVDVSQRLRAGQDRESKHYKSQLSMCPNITRIFPSEGASARRKELYSDYSESISNDHMNFLNNENGYSRIDYKLVRRCLKYMSNDEKCEVMDAIRLRIKSKSSSMNVALNAIFDLSRFDLFGFQCECRPRSLLEDLLWPMSVTASHPVQTSIARLLNAIVSHQIGRDYFNNRSIVRTLIWGEPGREHIEDSMADNLIAVMMKLSLNRFQCTDMLKKALLEWLLNHMEEVEYSASKYHLECMTGLLRNLLREEKAMDISSIEPQKIIVLLGRYLDTKNEIAKRNICASLLALFRKTKAVESANEMNFANVIEKHIENASDWKEKELLNNIQVLLTSSGTSKSYAHQLADDEIESVADTEVDYYLGESLLREKFCANKEKLNSLRHRKKNVKKSKTKGLIDDPQIKQDGHLISRVYIEHLHCFVPKTEGNRIFPMFNYRCMDKPPQTCIHLENTQPKRPPPQQRPMPKSQFHGRPTKENTFDDNASDSQEFLEKSIQELILKLLDDDEIKSVMQSGLKDVELENVIQSVITKRLTTTSSIHIIDPRTTMDEEQWKDSFEKREITHEISICSVSHDVVDDGTTRLDHIENQRVKGSIKSVFSSTNGRSDVTMKKGYQKDSNLKKEIIHEDGKRERDQLENQMVENVVLSLTKTLSNDNTSASQNIAQQSNLKGNSDQPAEIETLKSSTSPVKSKKSLIDARQESESRQKVKSLKTSMASDAGKVRAVETLKKVRSNEEVVYDTIISLTSDHELSAKSVKSMKDEAIAVITGLSDRSKKKSSSNKSKNEMVGRSKSARSVQVMKDNQIARSRSDQQLIRSVDDQVIGRRVQQLSLKSNEDLKDDAFAIISELSVRSSEKSTNEAVIRNNQKLSIRSVDNLKEDAIAIVVELSDRSMRKLQAKAIKGRKSEGQLSLASRGNPLTSKRKALGRSASDQQLTSIGKLMEVVKTTQSDQKSTYKLVEEHATPGSDLKLSARSIELFTDSNTQLAAWDVSNLDLKAHPKRKLIDEAVGSVKLDNKIDSPLAGLKDEAIRSNQKLSTRSLEIFQTSQSYKESASESLAASPESDTNLTVISKRKTKDKTTVGMENKLASSLEVFKVASSVKNDNKLSVRSEETLPGKACANQPEQQLTGSCPSVFTNRKSMDKVVPIEVDNKQKLSGRPVTGSKGNAIDGIKADYKLSARSVELLRDPENVGPCDNQLSLVGSSEASKTKVIVGTTHEEIMYNAFLEALPGASSASDGHLSVKEVKEEPVGRLKIDKTSAIKAAEKIFEEKILRKKSADKMKDKTLATPGRQQSSSNIFPKSREEVVGVKSDLLNARSVEIFHDEAASSKSNPNLSSNMVTTLKDEDIATPERDKKLSSRLKIDKTLSATKVEEEIFEEKILRKKSVDKMKDKTLATPGRQQSSSNIFPKSREEVVGVKSDLLNARSMEIIQDEAARSKSNPNLSSNLVTTLKDEDIATPERDKKLSSRLIPISKHEIVGGVKSDELPSRLVEMFKDEAVPRSKSNPKLSPNLDGSVKVLKDKVNTSKSAKSVGALQEHTIAKSNHDKNLSHKTTKQSTEEEALSGPTIEKIAGPSKDDKLSAIQSTKSSGHSPKSGDDMNRDRRKSQPNVMASPKKAGSSLKIDQKVSSKLIESQIAKPQKDISAKSDQKLASKMAGALRDEACAKSGKDEKSSAKSSMSVGKGLGRVESSRPRGDQGLSPKSPQKDANAKGDQKLASKMTGALKDEASAKTGKDDKSSAKSSMSLGKALGRVESSKPRGDQGLSSKSVEASKTKAMQGQDNDSKRKSAISLKNDPKLSQKLKDEGNAVPKDDGQLLSAGIMKEKAERRSQINRKPSAVSLEEKMLEERNLRFENEKALANKPQTCKSEGAVLAGDDQMQIANVEPTEANRKSLYKIRSVDSSVWREMLNNDELINRLCEKVLKRLLTEYHQFCGSNCTHPCGGLNPFYEANKAKHPNSE